jgi:dTMP kinase
MTLELGKYIVLEGSDGTGKSTQAIEVTRKLAELGMDPLLVYNDETDRMEPVQEPGGTPEANIIRKKIKDKTIARTPWDNVVWFTDARVPIWNDAILPALKAGRPVVTARSWISTVAYQGYGEGIPISTIEAYTKHRVGIDYMTPDLLIILALKSERSRRERMQARDSRHETDTFESMPEEFQTGMQNGYVSFAESHDVPILDASQTKEQVFDQIWEKVEAVL